MIVLQAEKQHDELSLLRILHALRITEADTLDVYILIKVPTKNLN